MVPSLGVRRNRFNIIGIAQGPQGRPRTGSVAKGGAARYVNGVAIAMGYATAREYGDVRGQT
jgi:hypothetical protein